MGKGEGGMKGEGEIGAKLQLEDGRKRFGLHNDE